MDNLASERAYNTPLANSPLLPLLLMSLATQKHTPDTSQDFKSEYDYVIIGSGAGGSVVANRLSELPCVSVLLLEAGKAPPRLTEVPAIALSFGESDIDWNYRTVPQLYSAEGFVNRQVVWPRGKALGGSTITNAMLYVRGNRQNYDDWEAQGATGWSYRDVLPYFKKLEDNKDPEFVRNGFHGTGGPTTAQKPRHDSELKSAVLEAAKELGYPVIDVNGPTQTGFYDLQANIRNGQRCSAAKSYLVPAENRTNLDILQKAFVKKIVIKDRRATGVQFDFGGKPQEVRARREVILSAGAVNTPQLLMLSGIGPRLELALHNIPVVADLPVGLNLQDHSAGVLGYDLSDSISPNNDTLKNPDNIQEYINKRSGPLTAPAGITTLAFLENPKILPGRIDFPDYELYFTQVEAATAKKFGVLPLVYDQYFGPREKGASYWCMSQILHPRSRGCITLKSSDPYDHPLINPNYYQNPLDLRDVVAGMKKCQAISRTNAFKKIGAKPFAFPLICGPLVLSEDLALPCIARAGPVTIFHPVGTAKMGNPSDPSTVVDPELRVKGIQGLRVVDASIMPLITSGNTNIPTLMIGEKASDMIKKTISCT